jgi:hypothetical protein
MRGRFQPHKPAACAQQQYRGDDREQQDPREQDDGRDFVTIDAARRALDEFVQDKLRWLLGPGRRHSHAKPNTRQSHGQRESA